MTDAKRIAELEAKLAEYGADVCMYRKTAQDNIASRNAAEAKLAEAEDWRETALTAKAGWQRETARARAAESREKALEAKLARAVEWAQEWKHEHSRRACEPNTDFDTASHHQSKARAYGECEDYLRTLAARKEKPPPGPPSSPDRCACGAITLCRNPDPQASARDPLTGIVHTRRGCRAALAAGKETP